MDDVERIKIIRGGIRCCIRLPSAAGAIDKKLTLKTTKKLIDKIQSDIDAAVKTYGGMNEAYFAHIRKLSVSYWYEADRREIFEEINKDD